MIPFTKAHGNGNDFVLFDAETCPESIRDPDFIQRVCNRHKGIGADGVLVISSSDKPDVDIVLDYYNADGSWETLCANGARCAVAFYGNREGIGGKVIVQTGAGSHEAVLLPGGQVQLQILTPRHITGMMEIYGFHGRHVDSGAPHFVIEVDELDEDLVARNGPPIRYHEAFQPRGVNVNFYQRIGPHALKVITYEKGVEAVMQSCASGGTAACFEAASSGSMTSPIKVVSPGGELMVAFDPEWKDATVTGPAVLLFDSRLPDDF
ncbi:MAG: diaminopimelate epimerase [Fidelibacterota bacterium]|nr:MAG: diaminopimelate epimerase [Candidatus Neomarinimicrobiota bacterium]